MAQQTAIDWLLENIQKVHKMDWDIVFMQAKAIEKEQIKKAFEEGGVQYMSNIGDDRPPKAEDYYNKTYQPNKVKTDK
jgi:hypothetical protein